MTLRFTSGPATINVMASAAMKAARGLIRDFGELEFLQVSRKSVGDFVSIADRRAEKVIHAELSRARPTYGFLMEESGVQGPTDAHFRWIVDPLDGTTNFLHGLPHFCISIALQKGREVVAATVYDPLRDELFWSEKGNGAFVNQRRMKVAGRQHLDEILLATGIPFGNQGNLSLALSRLQRVMPHIAGVRRLGAAALDLAYVAAGRCDAYFEANCAPWDIAAGLLLVKEAGGVIENLAQKGHVLESGDILATSPHLVEALRSLLVDSTPLPHKGR